MTDKKQEKSEEEKQEKQRETNVKKTLESELFKNTIGTNLVKNDPHQYGGKIGYQSADALYHQTMNGEEANKQKQQMYYQKLQKGRELGVAGEPSSPSNYDLSMQLIQQFKEVSQMATVGELEEQAKKLGANITSAPDELKKYSLQSIAQKYTNDKDQIDENKLGEKEKDALNYHQMLSDAYERGCALNATKENYFADIDYQAKQIADKYKKDNEKNKEA